MVDQTPAPSHGLLPEDDSARVLIVIPTLGRRVEYLRQTLASIQGQRVSTQVVAVMPAGANEARELAQGSGAAVADDPGSMSAAINLGATLAGPAVDYVNWLGDDDLLAPGAMQAAVDALDDRRDAVAAYGQCQYIDPAGRDLWVSKAGRIAPWLMTWGPDLVPQPGMLIRLEAWRKVGGLDPALRFAMDLDLLLRLRELGPFVSLPRILASFRWHPESLTVANRTASLDESELVKRRHATGVRRWLIGAVDPGVRVATRVAADRVNRRAARLMAG